MNLQLLESFGQNYPEQYDGVLDCISMAVTACFNRRGTLLAVGCNDGRVVLWDFLTKGIAKVISAHVHPVASVSFSRDGVKVLTASTDNTVCIIEALTGDCEMRFRFPSPVLKVQYNPRNSNAFLVCPLHHAALLFNIDGTHKTIPVDDESDVNIAATFDRRGHYVFTGNSKGKITVYSSSDMKMVASFKLTGAAATISVKGIEFSRREEWFLVNASDRIIRVYNTKVVLTCGVDSDPEPHQKLQDLVNKTTWKKCCFSGDGEYICAGSARQHAIYIWERSIGNLVKILHGSKGELLLDVLWHPVRPIVASISSGVVSLWTQNQVENWSAFAPDFKELDENVEYEERESEFDEEDEDKIVEKQNLLDEDELEVDVTKTDPILAFLSSDEEEENPNDLLFLPIAPEVEDPESAPKPVESLKRHSTDHKENSPTHPKKKKARAYDVYLENAPKDEVHPMLSSKSSGNKDKPSSSKKLAGSSKKHKDSKAK